MLKSKKEHKNLTPKWYTKGIVQAAVVAGLIQLLYIIIFQVPALEDRIFFLEEKNTTLIVEKQRLETQLIPFKTIALEKFTGPESERLLQLANQIEDLTNFVDPLKKPISYAVADIQVIIKSDEKVNTQYGDRGGFLAFVKNGISILYVSDTKSNARQNGKGEVIYTGNFIIQSNQSRIGEQVIILQDSDLIQIEFRKIPENSLVLGGKASIIINGDQRFEFEIPQQKMSGENIFIKEIKSKFSLRS